LGNAHRQDDLETFAAFKDSFSYGKRNDLLFKFLKNLPEAEAADFLQRLLELIGDAVDTDRLEAVAEHIFQGQVRAYAPKPDARPFRWAYGDAPMATMKRPLKEARVALLSSSGHFVEGFDPTPFGVPGMSQEQAILRINEFLRSAPSISEIPVDTPQDKLRVRHPGYDIRAAKRDPNTVFPLDRLRELAEQGLVGEFVSPALSFVGAAAQLRVKNETAPLLVRTLSEMAVDAVLLVPV